VAIALVPLGLTALPARASDPGPHGCIVADAGGNAAPTIYPNSGTSQIGGNSCTFTEVAGDGSGGWNGAAASWSIGWCAPVAPATTCTPTDTKTGTGPTMGPNGTIPPGNLVTISVTSGWFIAGTANGA